MEEKSKIEVKITPAEFEKEVKKEVESYDVENKLDYYAELKLRDCTIGEAAEVLKLTLRALKLTNVTSYQAMFLLGAYAQIMHDEDNKDMSVLDAYISLVSAVKDNDGSNLMRAFNALKV